MPRGPASSAQRFSPSRRRRQPPLAFATGHDSPLFVSTAATAAALRTAVGDADLIHLACHGVLDDRVPLSSALALTPPANPSPDDDGFLKAWEIFEDLTLDRALVVLSACQTALGDEVDGEGLVGLTQAFQHAGARAVVASLRAVGDASTADLMQRFHQGLASGLSAEDALRQAQIAALRGEPTPDRAPGDGSPRHPYDPFAWAGFQLYGDWR